MSHFYAGGLVTLHICDVLDGLAQIESESVNCIVTSPPYWGLRDYGDAGQIGLEQTFHEFLAKFLAVMAECKRVLRKDGTMWVNMGDSYASAWSCSRRSVIGAGSPDIADRQNRLTPNIREKSLIGQPWRLAFALMDQGWILRKDIIWSKPNPMPESTKDRPTTAHEDIFLFSKSPKYWYDAGAIRTPAKESSIRRWSQDLENQEGSYRQPGKTNGPMKAVGGPDKQRGHSRRHAGFNDRWDAMSRSEQQSMGANARSVWEIATVPYRGAHFATFPPEIPRRCISAGCPIGGIVLDPFAGSGTTLAVALALGRKAIGIDINTQNLKLLEARLRASAIPLPLEYID